MPVFVPDYISVVYSLFIPVDSTSARVLAFRLNRIVPERSKAEALAERQRRVFLRELRLWPGGFEAWWCNLAQGAYLRKCAELADNATLGNTWDGGDSDEASDEDSGDDFGHY